MRIIYKKQIPMKIETGDTSTDLKKGSVSSGSRFLGIVYTICVLVFLHMLSTKNGYFPIIFVVLISASAFAGNWFAKWYLKKENASLSLMKKIAWLNIVSWIIPAIGIFTGVVIMEVATHFPEEKRKMTILASIGLTLSLLNIVLSVYLMK